MTQQLRDMDIMPPTERDLTYLSFSKLSHPWLSERFYDPIASVILVLVPSYIHNMLPHGKKPPRPLSCSGDYLVSQGG